MQTVTVAADRITTVNSMDIGVLVGVAIVIVGVVWMVLANVRRQRHQPRA